MTIIIISIIVVGIAYFVFKEDKKVTNNESGGGTPSNKDKGQR